MKRVLVTGASGFVGANLVRRLLRDGHEVHVLLRKASNWRLEEIANDLLVHVGDLQAAEQLRRIVDEIRPEWIFHLAAYGAYSWQTDLSMMISTNIIGTANLVNACLATGFEALINAGSSSEYGFKDHAPNETELPEPNSNYAATKAAATLLCGATARTHHVCITTLRLYSVYGPYEEPRRLIPSVITLGLKGRLPKLANPQIARDYIHVDDTNDAFVAAVTRIKENGSVYNVGTGTQTSLREVIELARCLMKVPAEPVWSSMPDRSWDTDLWVADNRKIRRDLDWRPECSLEEGFRKTIEWFREHPQLVELYERQSG